MMDEAVGILYNDAHDRRVVISFADLQARMGPRGISLKERCCGRVGASLGGRACYWDSLETARQEVAENVSWLPKH